MAEIKKLTINNVTYDVTDEELQARTQETATNAQQNITDVNNCETNIRTQLQTQNATAQAQETRLTELENQPRSEWRETTFELQNNNMITYLNGLPTNVRPKAIIYDTALIIPYATAMSQTLESINGRVSLRDVLLLKISREDAQTKVCRFLNHLNIKNMLTIDLNALNNYFDVRRVDNADGTTDFWLRRTSQNLPANYSVGQRITIYMESRVAIIVDDWLGVNYVLIEQNRNR